jgi:hypothetical protein
MKAILIPPKAREGAGEGKEEGAVLVVGLTINLF